MTDYKEEQSNELEALESIYPEELEGTRHQLLYISCGWGLNIWAAFRIIRAFCNVLVFFFFFVLIFATNTRVTPMKSTWRCY